MKKFLHQVWIAGSVLGAITLLGVQSWSAWGATYNFIFNNTEQGANSTASPTLTVIDGKATTPGVQTMQAKDGVLAPAAARPETAPGASAAETGRPAELAQPASASVASGPSLVSPVASSERRWRVAGGLNGIHLNGGYTKTGTSLGIAYSLSPGIALSVFGGTGDRPHAGSELELRLLRLSLGRFDNIIETRLLVGASTLAAVSGNAVSAHAGARVEINIGEAWGVTAAGRVNYGYAMGEAGLAIHL